MDFGVFHQGAKLFEPKTGAYRITLSRKHDKILFYKKIIFMGIEWWWVREDRELRFVTEKDFRWLFFFGWMVKLQGVIIREWRKLIILYSGLRLTGDYE